jgi:threonyl-tRNA synthetase
MDNVDHRVLGRKLELFHQQEEAQGVVFWHPRGAVLYHLIEEYIRTEMRRALYQEVRTPSSWRDPCGRAAGTGRSLARTCFASRARSAVWP